MPVQERRQPQDQSDPDQSYNHQHAQEERQRIRKAASVKNNNYYWKTFPAISYDVFPLAILTHSEIDHDA